MCLLFLVVGSESDLEHGRLILCDDINDLAGDPCVDRVVSVEYLKPLSG